MKTVKSTKIIQVIAVSKFIIYEYYDDNHLEIVSYLLVKNV